MKWLISLLNIKKADLKGKKYSWQHCFTVRSKQSIEARWKCCQRAAKTEKIETIVNIYIFIYMNCKYISQ